MSTSLVGIPEGFRGIVIAMPRHYLPDEDWPDDLAYALRVFSMPSRVLILVELVNSGPLLRADLIQRLKMESQLVGRTLGDLEKLGVVTANIPPGDRRGRSVQYAANLERYEVARKAWTEYLMPKRAQVDPQ